MATEGHLPDRARGKRLMVHEFWDPRLPDGSPAACRGFGSPGTRGDSRWRWRLCRLSRIHHKSRGDWTDGRHHPNGAALTFVKGGQERVISDFADLLE